ncbi:TPA: hypothetical protein ACGTP8_001196 [Yersinia enterocolitica]|uniref:hypothetical protein n=1 Tax=Yersinia massiliensis TaxID=419257 RepID=UPI0028D770FB|nr:hypothetical protein [Yersinia massiliensis]
MFYFLQRRAEKKIVKKVDKAITELESVYLNPDYFTDGDDINLIELMQWTDTKLDAMAAAIEPMEDFIIEHHPDLIDRANLVGRITLLTAEKIMEEFQDELSGLGNILA